MKRRRDPERTPALEELDQRLADALQLGFYLAPEDVTSMVWDLESIAAEIEKLGGRAPARAVDLYEGMIGICLQKLDEMEDDGAEDLATLVGDLFVGWIRMRQAAGDDAGEPAAILVRRGRDVGFVDLAELAASALDDAGAEAYVRQLRGELVRAREAAVREALEPPRDGFFVYTGEKGWVRALRRFFAAREDLPALESLCLEPEATAEDCSALAELLEERDEFQRALDWVERGIALLREDGRDGAYEQAASSSFAAVDLPARRRDLLVKLGRADEALAEAWNAFAEAPDDDLLEVLLEVVPEPESAQWLAHAMDAVFGWRTLDRGRGRSNSQAVAYFVAARRCWLAAGLPGEWEALVQALHAHHGRKKALLADIQRLATAPAAPTPSPLERGRDRWRGEGR